MSIKEHGTRLLWDGSNDLKESLQDTCEKEFCTHNDITLVALRLADNKYIGSGGTDTGNRLFNTTRLP